MEPDSRLSRLLLHRSPLVKVVGVLGAAAGILAAAADLTVDLPEAAPKWLSWIGSALQILPAASFFYGFLVACIVVGLVIIYLEWRVKRRTIEKRQEPPITASSPSPEPRHSVKYVHKRHGFSYDVGKRIDGIKPENLGSFLNSGAFVEIDRCLASRDLLKAMLAIRGHVEHFLGDPSDRGEGFPHTEDVERWGKALREFQEAIIYAEKSDSTSDPVKYKELHSIHEALRKETEGAGRLHAYQELSGALSEWEERNP